MGLISLPSLVQKVRIDTKDMKAAQAEADKFGTKMVQNTKAVDSTISRLRKSQQEYTSSTRGMRTEVEDASRSLDGLVAGFNEVEPKTRRTKKNTDELGSSLVTLRQRIDANAKGFGLFTIATEKLKIPFIVAGMTALVSASTSLAAAGGAIVAQFGPMAGVLGAYPGILLSIKTSMGVVQEAMKQLTDKKNANDIVKPWTELNKVGAKQAIPGILAGLKTMNPLLKVVQSGYAELGTTIGRTFASAAKDLMKQPQFLANVGTIMKSNASLAGTFTAALKPAAVAISNIIVAAGPMTQAIANTFLKGAVAAEGYTSNVSRLTGFFNKAWSVASSFGRSILNIGVAIKNVFSIGAKAIGIDFVGGLESGTKKLRDMTTQAENIKKIQQYFQDAGPVVKEIGLIVRDLVKDLIGLGGGDANKSLLQFLQLFRKETLPAFNDLAQTASTNLLPALANLGTAYAKFSQVIGMSPLIETINNMAKLAITILDVVNMVPGLGNLLGTLLLIKTTTAGLSFGAKALGITSLLTSLSGVGKAGTAGAKGIGGLVQGLRGATGESKTFANKVGLAMNAVGSGAIGGLKKAVSSIPTAFSKVGTAAAKPMGAIKTAITSVPGVLAKTGASIGTIAKSMGTSLVTFGTVIRTGVVSGITMLGTALTPLIAGLKSAALAVKAFTLSLLTNPVFLIIAAIVALVAALVLLYKKNETFRNFVNESWQNIKNVIATVVGWITGTAVPWLVNAWQYIVGSLQQSWEAMRTVWNTVMTFLGNVFNVIRTLITTYFTTYFSIISTILNTIRTVISAVWQAIVAYVTTIVNILRAVIQTGFTVISNVINTVMGVIRAVITAGFNTVRTIIQTVIDVIRAVITGNFNAIPGIIAGAVNRIAGIMAGAMNSALGAVRNGITGILGAIGQLPGRIVGALGNLGGLLYRSGQSIVRGLIDGINSMIGSLRSAASNLASAVGGFFPGSPVKYGPLRSLNQGRAGKMIVDMLASGISSNGAASAAMKTQMNSVANAIPMQRTVITAPDINVGAMASPAPKVTPSTTTGSKQTGPTYQIATLQVTIPVVQDLTDPKVAKSVAGNIHKALDDYTRARG